MIERLGGALRSHLGHFPCVALSSRARGTMDGWLERADMIPLWYMYRATIYQNSGFLSGPLGFEILMGVHSWYEGKS